MKYIISKIPKLNFNLNSNPNEASLRIACLINQYGRYYFKNFLVFVGILFDTPPSICIIHKQHFERSPAFTYSQSLLKKPSSNRDSLDKSVFTVVVHRFLFLRASALITVI